MEDTFEAATLGPCAQEEAENGRKLCNNIKTKGMLRAMSATAASCGSPGPGPQSQKEGGVKTPNLQGMNPNLQHSLGSTPGPPAPSSTRLQGLANKTQLAFSTLLPVRN